MKRSLFIAMIFIYGLGYSQTKIEYEHSIALDSFPESARNSLKDLPVGIKKQRFYKELSNNKVSYETKFKYHKKYYSIEFGSTGILEDIEIIIHKNHINPDCKAAMEKHFNVRSIKFRWLKIQEQYRFDGEYDTSLFILDVLRGESSIRPYYEIIAEVKNNRSYTLKEYNFNTQGQVLSEKTVDPESYTHVLY